MNKLKFYENMFKYTFYLGVDHNILMHINILEFMIPITPPSVT